MSKLLLQNIFLIISIGILLVPSFWYWIYPHPQKIKRKQTELKEEHTKRVACIKKAIETAQKHQTGGTRVFGGAEPWKQAEMDELSWKERLVQEIVNYNEKIKELNKFPLTNALVIFGFFLTALGLHFQNK